MRYLLGTMIFIIGIFGCVTNTSTIVQDRETLVWDEMCTFIKEINDVGLLEPDYEPFYTCEDVKQPQVIYEWMRQGLYGYYEGGDTVYVSNRLVGGLMYGTLFHEYVHYLHVQLEMIEIPGYAEEVCWSEDQAFRLEGIWSGQDNSTWWKAYPYCWPYYGDENYRNAYIVIQLLEDWIEGVIDNIIENVEN